MLEAGGDDEGDVWDAVVVVGRHEGVEIRGNELDAGSVGFRIGLEPL